MNDRTRVAGAWLRKASLEDHEHGLKSDDEAADAVADGCDRARQEDPLPQSETERDAKSRAQHERCGGGGPVRRAHQGVLPVREGYGGPRKRPNGGKMGMSPPMPTLSWFLLSAMRFLAKTRCATRNGSLRKSSSPQTPKSSPFAGWRLGEEYWSDLSCSPGRRARGTSSPAAGSEMRLLCVIVLTMAIVGLGCWDQGAQRQRMS